MKKEITFKNFMWGYFWIILPFGIISTILTLLGQLPFILNGKEIYGIRGALITLIYIPVFTLIFAVLNWGTLAIGLWIKDKVESLFKSKKKDIQVNN